MVPLPKVMDRTAMPELEEAQEDCLHVVPLCGMITISDVTADGKAQPLLLRLRSKKLKESRAQLADPRHPARREQVRRL